MANRMLQFTTARKIEKNRFSDLSKGNVLGISSADVPLLREKYGSNRLSKQKRIGVIRQFFMNCNDPIIRILIGALILNIICVFPDVNWYETVGIGFAIFISAFVTTVSEYSSDLAFKALNEKIEHTLYTVKRDNLLLKVPIGDIVVTDLIYLSPGEIVPVDGILVAGSVHIDASSLTGESRTIAKMAAPSNITAVLPESIPVFSSEEDYAVFRGSAICSGECQLFATRVGDNTMYGALAAELQGQDIPSPLKERLSSLARTISKIGYASALLVAVAHLLKVFWFDTGMRWDLAFEKLCTVPLFWHECLTAFTMAISIVVVAVPEGLPMMITVVLSSNMKKMLKSGVLVRKLIGIETSGNLSILFTDKTGTITTGELTLSQIYTPEKCYVSLEEIQSDSCYFDTLKSGALACGSITSPNTTEKAINRFLELENIEDYSIPAQKLPFDSERKYSSARVASADCDILYICGAPEILLPLCDSWLDSSGIRRNMDDRVLTQIRKDMEAAAQKEFRIVLQASGEGRYYNHLIKTGLHGFSLTLTALLFLQDEIRSEVPDAVQSCHEAGIQVIMLTGDHAHTAASIAHKCGIIEEKWETYSSSSYHKNGLPLVLTGSDLCTISDEKLAELLPDIRVIARVTPMDKSRLVRVAQSIGHIVGMTGDGINDAPALKAADVGFAMGSGTDVSKAASDIIIMDNNFSSIHKAVLFGRTIFHNIRKFIVFQLIMNLSAVGISLIGPLVGVENPVTVIQMLWINIIMDTLGSLAFAGEIPLSEYMMQRPLKRNEPILGVRQLRQILLSAAYTIALCTVFLCSSATRTFFRIGNEVYFLTAFFALFVFCGICNAFTVRTSSINLLKHLRKNKAFLLIMPSVAVIQLFIVYFGGSVFRTVPLSGDAILFCLICALTVLPVDCVRKLLFKNS